MSTSCLGDNLDNALTSQVLPMSSWQSFLLCTILYFYMAIDCVHHGISISKPQSYSWNGPYVTQESVHPGHHGGGLITWFMYQINMSKEAHPSLLMGGSGWKVSCLVHCIYVVYSSRGKNIPVVRPTHVKTIWPKIIFLTFWSKSVCSHYFQWKDFFVNTFQSFNLYVKLDNLLFLKDTCMK